MFANQRIWKKQVQLRQTHFQYLPNREAERYEEMAVAQLVLARADADAAVAQDRFFEAETLRAEFRRQQAEAAVMAAAARVVRELEEYIKILNLDSVVFYHFESVH